MLWNGDSDYERSIPFSRDLLREAVQSKSERGEQLNALMKEGKLVPMVSHRCLASSVFCREQELTMSSSILQEVVLDLLKENMIKNVETSKGFLIDGYPREVPQANKFEEMVRHLTTLRILFIGKTCLRSDRSRLLHAISCSTSKRPTTR